MKDKIGRIEIARPSGTEIWNLKSGQFSIDKHQNRFRLNFWIQSDTDYIKKLEDTGYNPISFEITVPLITKPKFEKLWSYNYPEYALRTDNDGHFDNFYYYSHDSLKNIEIQIIKNESSLYLIQVIGKRGDPIDFKYGDAEYKIIANLPLSNVFKPKWDE